MKKATLLAIALLSVTVIGCDSPKSTFGLAVNYNTDDGLPGGGLCELAGNGQSSAWQQIDDKPRPPALWLYTDQDFSEDSTYLVQAYLSTDVDGNTTTPELKKILVERRYDERFGEGKKQDTFHISFEGAYYTITVTGIPGWVPPSWGCPSVSIPASESAKP